MSLNFNRLRDFNIGSEFDKGSANVIILVVNYSPLQSSDRR